MKFVDYTSPSVRDLADRWWLLVLRGIAALAFGILTLVMPEFTLVTLVVLWGAYALVDGAFNLVWAVRGARSGRRWGWLLFEGLVSVAAGVVTFAWPGITALVLLMVIAAWAVITGIAEIVAAIRLRHHMRGEWLLAASGVASIALGVLLFAFPDAGVLALLWAIGAYAIVFGVLLVVLGVQLQRTRHRSERAMPAGGAPTPA